MKKGHVHLDVVGRDGARIGETVSCRACVGRLAPSLPPEPLAAPEPTSDRLHKRWIDRTYRRAVAQLRDRHADEFAALLNDARSF